MRQKGWVYTSGCANSHLPFLLIDARYNNRHWVSQVNTNQMQMNTPSRTPRLILFLPHLIWSITLSCFPRSAFHSWAADSFPFFQHDTHHFITLMYLVGFSRRCRPPVMQRQMPAVQRQLLLMFKVMQGDRLIKRRLREAPGPSFSHREGLVTSGSRVLLPRYKGRWIKCSIRNTTSPTCTHIFFILSPLDLNVQPDLRFPGVRGETSHPCFN